MKRGFRELRSSLKSFFVSRIWKSSTIFAAFFLFAAFP